MSSYDRQPKGDRFALSSTKYHFQDSTRGKGVIRALKLKYSRNIVRRYPRSLVKTKSHQKKKFFINNAFDAQILF